MSEPVRRSEASQVLRTIVELGPDEVVELRARADRLEEEARRCRHTADVIDSVLALAEGVGADAGVKISRTYEAQK